MLDFAWVCKTSSLSVRSSTVIITSTEALRLVRRHRSFCSGHRVDTTLSRLDYQFYTKNRILQFCNSLGFWVGWKSSYVIILKSNYEMLFKSLKANKIIYLYCSNSTKTLAFSFLINLPNYLFILLEFHQNLGFSFPTELLTHSYRKSSRVVNEIKKKSQKYWSSEVMRLTIW